MGLIKNSKKKKYIKQVVKIQVNDMKVKKRMNRVGIKAQKVYFKIVLGFDKIAKIVDIFIGI